MRNNNLVVFESHAGYEQLSTSNSIKVTDIDWFCCWFYSFLVYLNVLLSSLDITDDLLRRYIKCPGLFQALTCGRRDRKSSEDLGSGGGSCYFSLVFFNPACSFVPSLRSEGLEQAIMFPSVKTEYF